MSGLHGKTRTFTIPFKPDENGFIGRQCPDQECHKYFKVKPGTGLTAQTVAYCPYCGSKAEPSTFITDEQKAYAVSVVGNQVMKEVLGQLKKHEFDIKAGGPFGIGFSLRVEGRPAPVRYYRERVLETEATCAECTLQFAIYGIFAYCPDCGIHNSLGILQKNLDVVLKFLTVAEALAPELRDHLVGDCLENAVSTFDGFGRHLCRMAASRASDPQQAVDCRFQNLQGAQVRVKELFGYDISTPVEPAAWTFANRCFEKRHLLAHNLGVVDQKYVDHTGDDLTLGGKVPITRDEVEQLTKILRLVGEKLVAGINKTS